jgi:hypothetical protein
VAFKNSLIPKSPYYVRTFLLLNVKEGIYCIYLYVIILDMILAIVLSVYNHSSSSMQYYVLDSNIYIGIHTYFDYYCTKGLPTTSSIEVTRKLDIKSPKLKKSRYHPNFYLFNISILNVIADLS